MKKMLSSKSLMSLVLAVFVAAPAFAAAYVVVLRDGTQYAAKAKWKIVNGKALIHLEDGRTVQLDPKHIDEAKSEAATKVGMANARILDLNPTAPEKKAPVQPSLGSQIRLRRPQQQEAEVAPVVAPAPVTPATAGLPRVVVDKFQRAYENVGIFEHKVESTGANSLRAEMTVDTEERVFNAISATSFLMIRDAGADNVRIDVVEMFMKTTAGGAAGRFRMTRADAKAIDDKAISHQDYFVRNVIY